MAYKYDTIIRKRRKQLGYTLIDMEELSGITERTIRKMESGNLNVKFDSFLTILNLLGLQFDVTIKKMEGKKDASK
jgi:transcriptional regulator with XRE-family HTH domain